MKRLVPIMAALIALSACGGAAEPEGLAVETAWVRLPAVSGRPGAAYFTIRGGAEPVRLTAVTSPAAGRVELHESRMEGGMMGMAPLAEVAVAPRERIAFEPGGRHAMLFDLRPGLSAGDKVTLNFAFGPLPPISVEADVRAAGDEGHGGH
jgi:copper(I)-binding protein